MICGFTGDVANGDIRAITDADVAMQCLPQEHRPRREFGQYDFCYLVPRILPERLRQNQLV